jgi:CubicO group peptidase (beta-lactamase class C family)
VELGETAMGRSRRLVTDVRMHVASCSKLITAIALTKLLNDSRLSYDTPIVGFLPSYWAKGPNVNTITFRHLMTHTSGLGVAGQSDSDFEFMKTRVAAGGVPAPAPYMYQNMNFGLCRILIATIAGKPVARRDL